MSLCVAVYYCVLLCVTVRYSYCSVLLFVTLFRSVLLCGTERGNEEIKDRLLVGMVENICRTYVEHMQNICRTYVEHTHVCTTLQLQQHCYSPTLIQAAYSGTASLPSHFRLYPTVLYLLTVRPYLSP